MRRRDLIVGLGGVVAWPFAARAQQPAMLVVGFREQPRALAVIAKHDGPGLIVSPSPVNTVNRKRLISLANEMRIPAIYPFRFYVQDGALLAYGFNAADQFKRAAVYASRILKDEKAGDLPVQGPSLFEFGINLKTAKAMGLTVPQPLLIAADEIVQ